MKSRSGKLLSILFCLAVLASMLTVGAVSSSAAVSGPGNDVQYMYKFDRGTQDAWSNFIYTKVRNVTFAKDEVYRLSFYYKAEEGSEFENGSTSLQTPFNFAVRHSLRIDGNDTDPNKYCLVERASVKSADDTAWYYLEYDMTIGDDLNGRTMIGFGFQELNSLNKAETLYFTDVRLCKVDGETVGENLAIDFCGEPTLKNWYFDGGFRSEQGYTTGSGTTLSILPIDRSLFSRQTADTTPPTFAANAQITVATSSSLSVSWDAASDDTTAAEQIVYKVYASTSAFGGTLSGEPLATVTGTTSAELTGLTANTAYYLAIAAIDEAGNSAVWYGENPAKTSPASSSTTGELVISADVGVAYTLSIPSAPVNMTAAGEQKLGTLYATALRLGANDTLNVTVAHNDVLTHVNGTNTLAYALSAAAHGSAEKAALAPIAFTNGSTLGEAGGTDLFVSIDEADWNAAPAGVYKDTVTFTVAYTAG